MGELMNLGCAAGETPEKEVDVKSLYGFRGSKQEKTT